MLPQCPVRAAFGNWVEKCGLSQFLKMELWQSNPDPLCWGRIPLRLNQANQELDCSNHGHLVELPLYHGTCFSCLPSILSAGCLLRCSTPTRGRYAIWTAKARWRAVTYAPSVILAPELPDPVQCILKIHCKRVAKSHFKTGDKQPMTREVWHQLSWLEIIKSDGQPTFRGTHAFGRMLPQFRWSPSFANWQRLPEPWIAETNNGAAASNSSRTAGTFPPIPTP